MLGMVPMPASAVEAAQMNGGPQQPQYDVPYDAQPPAYDAKPYDAQPYGSTPIKTDYGYSGGDAYGCGPPQYDSSAPDYVPPQGYDAPGGAYGQPAYGGGDPRQEFGADIARQQAPPAAAAPDPRQQQYPQQAPYSPPPLTPAAQPEPQQPPAATAQAQLDADQQKGVL